jgi:glycosyltransferase involved in cell wall biosynthesis
MEINHDLRSLIMSSTDTRKEVASRPGTFVIPFYADQSRSVEYLKETLDSLFAQTDQNWNAVIIDDASPGDSHKAFLKEIETQHPNKIKVLWQKVNQGQGTCRNLAIRWAFEQGSPFILFNDADDISHPDRLQVTREIFLEHPTVDLVYSSFLVIDENSQLVPRDRITPSVVEIIEANETHPVEGYNAWIEIGTVTGFACLPSSTAVRTAIAFRCPFPHERVSEDSYAWMLIAACGNEFRFTPQIPTLYRIPHDKAGSTHRTRVGRKKFYEEKARVDTNAFLDALQIALDRGTVPLDQAEDLKLKFFNRLATSLIKEDEAELAEYYMNMMLSEAQR